MADGSTNIKGSLNIEPVAAYPSNAVKGDVCCLAADGKLYEYNGTTWSELSTGSSGITMGKAIAASIIFGG